MQNPIERIYTDGACSGNPGPGGWGVVAYLANGSIHEMGGRDAKTTNNRMELQGAIAALQLLVDIRQETPVILYTDSEYVKNGITKWIVSWKKKKWKTSTGKDVVNQDLWQQLDALNSSLKSRFTLTWEYVRGHAGNEGNERCDAIARAFSQNSAPVLQTIKNFGSTSSTHSLTPSSSASAIPTAASSASSTPSTLNPNSGNSDGSVDASMASPKPSNPAPNSEQTTMAQSNTVPAPSSLESLRHLVETLQLADVIAEQRYLITTSELADLVGISVTTATNRGDNWIWRNWQVMRVRQEGNQLLWHLERVS